MERGSGRDKRIFDLWLACYTQEEIAEQVGCHQTVVGEVISRETASLPETLKPAASHLTDFDPPLQRLEAAGEVRRFHPLWE